MNKRILTLAVGGLLLTAAGFVADSHAEEAKKGLQFGGSMRGRYEAMSFSENADGSKKETRGRIRYRLRLDGKALINPKAQFYFRLASGTDSRSGNVTLGDPADYAPNALSIRYAALVYSPWDMGKLPDEKGHWKFDFGRVKNPYIWKGHGKDMMLWDGDISLTGAGTQFDRKLGDSGSIFVNAGYYAIDENGKGEKDPYLAPVQLGLLFGEGKTTFGIRGSYYYMNELDADFVSRGVNGENIDGSDGATSSGGNVEDGLTGSADGGRLAVVSTQAFASTALGSVPLTLSGGYSDNTSAKASVMFPGVGKNSIAYNIGLEGGAKKKALMLGAGWYHTEANAFPSQFIDSDLLDGYTNREGLLIYLSKTIMKSTDFNVQFFSSNAIATDPGLEGSANNAKRDRLQVDILYKF
ncbi:MAG: putative porin [Candidatus Krumholzibacteria bacterium]|nr:putative porin [Candidatus Krumholzibacteria bacterium]